MPRGLIFCYPKRYVWLECQMTFWGHCTTVNWGCPGFWTHKLVLHAHRNISFLKKLNQIKQYFAPNITKLALFMYIMPCSDNRDQWTLCRDSVDWNTAHFMELSSSKQIKSGMLDAGDLQNMQSVDQNELGNHWSRVEVFNCPAKSISELLQHNWISHQYDIFKQSHVKTSLQP